MPAQSPTLSPDVVGDDGRVARIVLRDADFDLPDEIGADVGSLRVDAAAETSEDRDQRASEREPDELAGGVVGSPVEPVGEDAVVGGDAEQAQPDDEETRDGARAERDVERRAHAALRSLRRTDVRAHGDVHPDEAGGGGQHRADEEAERRSPAEVVPEADADEDDDRHARRS